MTYTKQTWVNGSGGGTPVSAVRLGHIEDGLESVDTTLTGVVADVAATQQPFDARNFGVIADGAQHNNVANLLDCFTQAAAAGATEVILPAGVIVTSEAVAGVTVTADSGSTYTNNGGIPLPVNKAMTISGHGKGVTTLKLSAGFPRAFDFWWVADGQNYHDITIRDLTVDRNSLTGLSLAPLTAVTGGVTLATGAWTTLPGISAVTFKNARAVYFSNSNTGTAKNIAMLARVSGSNFQVRNDTGGSLTLVTGDQVRGCLREHVIVGTFQFGGGVPQGWNMTINNLTVENCEATNVSTNSATTFTSPALIDRNTGIAVVLSVNTGNPVMTPTATNCRFRNVQIYGGECGISVTGGTFGCFVDQVWMEDCFHDTLVNPPGNYPSSNFHIGSRAWVGHAGLIRCHGKRSGDVAYEANQPWEFYEEDCLWEDSFSGAYRSTFTPPARTSAGPPTTTLSGSLTNVATTTTIAALPAGVDRRGVAVIDSELVWYVASSTAGTALTIYRGINGTTAASHSSGATVTFVETFKTRVNSTRSTFRNSSTLMGIANAGRCYLAFENSSLPLPPMTIRDPKFDIRGGDMLLLGYLIYWDGWVPDFDMQGARMTWDGFTCATGAFGSAIGWDWIGGPPFVTNSVPIPAPRIYGRNNTAKLHGVFSGGGWATILGPNRGYALVDFDLDGECVFAGSGNNGYASIAYIEPPNSPGMVFAPQSRLGLQGRFPGGMASDNRPVVAWVQGSAVTIQAKLDLDINAYEMVFDPTTKDDRYSPWVIGSTLVGKVRIGKLQHAKTTTSNYLNRKRHAVKVSGTYTVTPEDEIVLCDTSGGAVTVNLPDSVGGSSGVGEPLTRGSMITVVDAGFNAATNNITVHPVSTDKLDNGTAGANVTISTNGAHKTYVSYPTMPGYVSV